MSVIIMGMEMPKSLGKNVTIYPDGRVVDYESGKKDIVGNAIEVPDGHGALIDRMALLESIKEARKRQPEIDDVYTEDYFIVAEWLMSAPIVIPSDKEGK